jgi:hypothetical protein
VAEANACAEKFKHALSPFASPFALSPFAHVPTSMSVSHSAAVRTARNPFLDRNICSGMSTWRLNNRAY